MEASLQESTHGCWRARRPGVAFLLRIIRRSSRRVARRAIENGFRIATLADMNHPLQKLPEPAPGSLDLPFDFPPIRGRKRHFESYAFALPLEPDDDDRAAFTCQSGALGLRLASAFAVLLARYTGQTSVSFTLSDPSANREPLWTRSVTLEIDETATCRAILTHVSEALRAPDAVWAWHRRGRRRTRPSAGARCAARAPRHGRRNRR